MAVFARAWAAIQPDLVILTEGERWPEHLEQALARGVPAVHKRAAERPQPPADATRARNLRAGC